MNKENDYCVYMVCCADNSLYTGIAVDVEKRIEVHNSGKGAKYTKAFKPVKIVYKKGFKTKSEAMKEEYRIKHKLTKSQKLELIRKAN